MEGRHDADPNRRRVHFATKGAGAQAPPVGRLPAGPEGIWVCRKRAPGTGARKRRRIFLSSGTGGGPPGPQTRRARGKHPTTAAEGKGMSSLMMTGILLGGAGALAVVLRQA